MIKETEHFWQYAGLVGLSAFVLLPEAVGTILALVLLVAGVVRVVREPKLLRSLREILAITFLIPLIYLLAFAWDPEAVRSGSMLGRSFLFVILPFISNTVFRDLKPNRILEVASGTLFITATVKLLFAVLLAPEAFWLTSFWDRREQVEALTDIHGTYWGFIYGILALIALYAMVRKFPRTWLYVPMLLVSLCVLLIINAKMPLLATLAMGMLILLNFSRTRGLLTGLLIVIAIVIGLASLQHTSKSYFTEIRDFMANRTEYPEGLYDINHNRINSLMTRRAILDCSLELFAENPWKGYGLSHAQTALNTCYFRSYNTNLFELKTFNTHNQYLGFLLSGGVIALGIYLIFIVWSFSFARSARNILGIFLLVYVSLCLLTENIYDRHFGALMATYIIGVFILNKNTETW